MAHLFMTCTPSIDQSALHVKAKVWITEKVFHVLLVEPIVFGQGLWQQKV